MTYWKNTDHGRANGLLPGEFLQICAEKEKSLNERRIGDMLAVMGLESLRALSRILNGLQGSRETISEAEREAYAGRSLTAKTSQTAISRRIAGTFCGSIKRLCN